MHALKRLEMHEEERIQFVKQIVDSDCVKEQTELSALYASREKNISLKKLKGRRFGEGKGI